MIIERPWTEDIEVDDRWDTPCKIARHRIYVYWSHPELLPCDEMGIRIPAGFSSFKEKYRASEGKCRIFCFGGSTTIGAFCGYEGSFPHHLEGLLKNTAVFNFGLGGCDCRGSMYLLLDLLRWGYVPDLAIFLDGINEKQGWFQSLNGYKNYEETSCQYGYFRTLIEQHLTPMTYGWNEGRGFIGKIKKNLQKIRRSKENLKIAQDPFRFIAKQAEYYIKTNKTIRKLAQAWNIKTKFFLQPILWDIWKDQGDRRYDYIKMLYRNIMSNCSDIVDLSQKIPLTPSEFIDWQHLTPSGNKALAEVIFQEIRR